MNANDNISPLILGFYDTISVLVPGAIFWSILLMTYPETLDMYPPLIIPGGLVFSVATGYLLLALGNFLYGCYIHPNKYKNRIYVAVTRFIHNLVKFFIREDYGYKGVDLREATITLLKKRYQIKTEIDDLGLFQLCDILASKQRNNNDRDVLLAKEGLFRSLSALFFVLLVFYFLFLQKANLNLLILILFVLVERLCIYGNNYFKRIRQSQVYVSAYMALKEENNART